MKLLAYLLLAAVGAVGQTKSPSTHWIGGICRSENPNAKSAAPYKTEWRDNCAYRCVIKKPVHTVTSPAPQKTDCCFEESGTPKHEPALPSAGHFNCWFPTENSHKCIDSKGEDVTKVVYPAIPPDMDTAAVKRPSTEPPNGPKCMIWPCGHEFTAWCHNGEGAGDFGSTEVCENKPPLVDTCIDTRRIGPLYSADGKSHCLLFQESK